MRIREQQAVVRGGFTLMEMLVVVAIIVVLAGAAVPIYMSYLEDAKVNRALIDCKTLSSGVEAFYLKYGDFPAGLDVLTQPGPDGSPPKYEISALIDPWNRQYQYANPGTHNVTGKPDIWSLGPRPEDPNGIIGNWPKLAQ